MISQVASNPAKPAEVTTMHTLQLSWAKPHLENDFPELIS